MAVPGWSQIQVSDPLSLVLDPLNPRIDVVPDPTQDQIRLQLLKHEDIVALAKGIITMQGLMPGERIIVVREDNQLVVLEGNRRMCAVQLLLDPSLVPGEMRQFPRVTSQELMVALSTVDADLAPNRVAADPVLTKRHTERSVRPWATVARHRRSWQLVDSGMSVADVAERFGTTVGAVRRAVREYRLLDQVKRLPVWTSEERDILDDERLPVTSYLRFFQLEDAKSRLAVSFNADERLVTDLPRDLLEAVLESIARTLLLPSREGTVAASRMKVDDVLRTCPKYEQLVEFERQRSRPGRIPEKDGKEQVPYNTADDKVDVASASSSQRAGEAGSSKDSDNTSQPTVTVTIPKPPRFFETLAIAIHDPILEQIVFEIRLIQHYRMPYAATCLVRALLEACLRYQLKKSGKWDAVVGKSGRDPSLETMITFAADRSNRVFKDNRAADVLDVFRQSGHKDLFDLVIHAQWAHASAQTLEQAASLLRQLFVYILNDEHRGEFGATTS